MSNHPNIFSFEQFSLSKPVIKAVKNAGYQTPSPIQLKAIPTILSGKDILAQAQTGTGKTAAFALPMLSGIDLNNFTPQILVLTPTRELAIQVSESFAKYGSQLPKLNVSTICGGRGYRDQLRQLKKGSHVIVGTPGRIIDHIKRGTLILSKLKCLVLDEADEMLKMGFKDDVEWVLGHAPKDIQTTLFSATIPQAIKRIAKKYLNAPEEVYIKGKSNTATTVHQQYWPVRGTHKLDALTRILEAQSSDGVIIFVRTKAATIELSDKLKARGFATAAINGDIEQKYRERTIDQLKKGHINILVATDVAARGLDVERIGQVINYDIPFDTESYIHRIGRTGRAGRKGNSILFVAPREERFLKSIERSTKQKIEKFSLPSSKVVTERRIASFKSRISRVLESSKLDSYLRILHDYQEEHGTGTEMLAAALLKLAQEDNPLFIKETNTQDKELHIVENQKRKHRNNRHRSTYNTKHESHRFRRSRRA